MSVDKYLRTFRRERARLLALPEATVRGTTVDLVIRLSLDRLRREKGNGILVIDVCAYLGADSIPRDLLDRVAESMNRHVTAIGWLPALLSYSLVKATTSDITIHTLTQEVARSTHSVRIRKRLVSQAVELVLNWVDDDPDRTRKVAPHLIAVAAHSTSLGMRYPRLAKALSAVSITALVSGERAVATDSAVSALKNLATESDRDAKTAADIILALTATGRYDDAIISARQWIALLETSVDNGPSALSTGYIWSILARALACAGKGAEAVQALRRADLISRANLDEAPLTMMLLMAMTHAYISLEMYGEGVATARRAVQIAEREHLANPDTSDQLRSATAVLAEALSYAGLHEEALQILLRSLDFISPDSSPDGIGERKWIAAMIIVKASKAGVAEASLQEAWDKLGQADALFWHQ